MPSPTPSVAMPPRISGLELCEVLGEGGSSTVYRAVHSNLQRTVAVKILRNLTTGGAASPTWLRESRLMASLAHPHVVSVHDAGQVEGHDYLVMEYMAGGSLRSRMRPNRPWPLTEALSLLDSIAQALCHIHERGILHLDLKPENVLYTAEGQIKITDFGLSIPNADAGAILSSGLFRGTLDYCAPEYRSGLTLDARFDVFSLAVIAYELLTGRVPGRVYVPASQRNPHLPAALDEVLRRGLARDPSERWVSIAKFRQALIDARPPTTPRISFRLLALIAVLVAVITIPLVAYTWRSIREQPTAPDAAPQDAKLDRPDRLLILYDKPDDLALFATEGKELSGAVPVEQVAVENPPGNLPTGLPLPVWPTPRPVLILHSPGTWGFVHPLADRALAQRVVDQWPTLLRMVVSPERNRVKAGGFDGDCLATNHQGNLWRVGDTATWTFARQITLDRAGDQPGNPALRLTNLDPSRNKTLLGCYQPMTQGLPSSAVVVLRYRARSLRGQGSLAVYAGMSISEGESGPQAVRIRASATRLPPEPGESVSNRLLYRSPAWVTPATQWQTYLVIVECPSFQTLHRNLVIDLGAARPEATDEVWVDDVELFVWQPGNES